MVSYQKHSLVSSRAFETQQLTVKNYQNNFGFCQVSGSGLNEHVPCIEGDL